MKIYRGICILVTLLAFPSIVGFGISSACARLYRDGNRHFAYFVAFLLLYFLPTIIAVIQNPHYDAKTGDDMFIRRGLAGVGSAAAGAIFWALGAGGDDFLSSHVMIVAMIVGYACILAHPVRPTLRNRKVPE